MNRTIGILGCGWLGMPLAKSLVNSGIQVKGTTTSATKLTSLKRHNISAYLVALQEMEILGEIGEFLSNLDVLILNVPPKLRKASSGNYYQKMKLLLEQIHSHKVNHVVFISSTSVYGHIEGEITEEIEPNPISKSGKQLLQSEKLFLGDSKIATAVVRFGGLIAEDRHPVFNLSGKSVKNGEEFINLIHRSDCIHMIKTIIDRNYWNQIFNGVFPYHPTKKEYYISEAKKRGIPPPIYQDSDEKIYKKKVVFKNFYVKGHQLTTSISS